MRIGIDAGRALHGAGGVASYTRELVRGLAAHATSDRVVLFDLDHGEARRRVFERVVGGLPPGVEVCRPEAGALRSLDVLHAPGFVMPPAGAARQVFTIHDLTVLSHPGFHTPANRARTLIGIAEALVRGATLLAVSEATRAEAERLLALSGAQVAVVPPILDPTFSAAPAGNDEAVARRRGADRPFVLVVASLEPRKNLDRLLDAWECLPDGLRRDHGLLLVASAGWLSHGLERRLRGLRRSGEVSLLGGVPAAELAALYRRTRALVYPSLVEGFGLPVAEAMACGAPVITSDRSSMPEVAGDAAVLVDPEDVDRLSDALAKVLEDGSLRRELRARGVERARRFAAAEVVPRLLALYRRICGLLG